MFLERGGRPVGVNVHFRLRRSIESVYQELGDELFRRAYRMTYPTFLELHRLLEPEMMIIHKEYMDDLTFQRKEKRGQSEDATEIIEHDLFRME